MREWAVYPAIDLRGGRVVRLAQGDPERETAYSSDPARVAQTWLGQGAEWLHVVNLDGAFGAAAAESAKALEAIVALGAKVQFGGGLRDMEAIRRAVDLGVQRVVLGTAAVEDPGLVRGAIAGFGRDRVALGIDARMGEVRTRGWKRSEPVAPLELARWWSDSGARWLIYTDVSRDGMGGGLDTNTAAALAQESEMHVIVAGGASSVEDVRLAWEAGLAGVILGRALYEGYLDLRKALAVGKDGRPRAG